MVISSFSTSVNYHSSYLYEDALFNYICIKKKASRRRFFLKKNVCLFWFIHQKMVKQKMMIQIRMKKKTIRAAVTAKHQQRT